MPFLNSHKFKNFSRPTCVSFIHYSTICGLFICKRSLKGHETVLHRFCEQDMTTGGFTYAHQQESPMQFLHSLTVITRTLRSKFPVHTI